MTSESTRVEEPPHAQRRVLIVLVAAQVLSGAGLAAGVTVGALLAQEMFGSTSLAGLPSAVGTAGSALAAVVVGRVSQARGRRPGLAGGYLAGAIGSAGVIAAAVAGNAVLLMLALFVYGAGTATNLLARYAGADLATPARRARAVSTVLVATTLGGVVGPNLTAPTGALARTLGIPYLAGPFLLAGAAYGIAALVLAIWLRPDPLLLARTLEAEHPTPPDKHAEQPPAPHGQADQPTARYGQPQHPAAPYGQAEQLPVPHGQAEQPAVPHRQPQQPAAPYGQPQQPTVPHEQPQQPAVSYGQPAAPYGQAEAVPPRVGPRTGLDTAPLRTRLRTGSGADPAHAGHRARSGADPARARLRTGLDAAPLRTRLRARLDAVPARAGLRAGLPVGVLVMALTQAVMVAIMTMTPVHMHDHGHGAAASGLVIALHIGAMYLPSPLTGWLVDRYGRLTIAATSGLVLLAAGILAATAPDDSVAMFAVALVLLGVGWNFGLVSGTAIVTDAIPLATRARTQGLVDVCIAVAGAGGGMISGLVVAGAGYPLLALSGGILALAIIPTVLATRK